MIKLFSEEVKTTSTNSDHNTLYVEKWNELFFGVYGFEINKSDVIAERIGYSGSDPVVRIPVSTPDGIKTDKEFVLKKGKELIELGSGEISHKRKEVQLTEKVTKPTTPKDLIKTDYETLYVEKCEELHFGIYELSVNGNTFIAEQIDAVDGRPVVKVSVEDGNGVATDINYIIRKGKATQLPVQESVVDVTIDSLQEYSDFGDVNTLYVESINEAFYGVYEFNVGDKKVIAEKVSDYKGNPVVRMPVQDTNGLNNYEFVLKVGSRDSNIGDSKVVLEDNMTVIREVDIKDKVKAEHIVDKSFKLNTEKANLVDEEFISKDVKLESTPIQPVEVDYDNLDTLYVEKFDEVHFGIYEFDINGKTVIAEQIDTVQNNPLVKLPIEKEDGSKVDTAFILKIGKGRTKAKLAELLSENVKSVVTEDNLFNSFDKAKSFEDQAKTIIEGVEDIKNANKILSKKIRKETRDTLEATHNEFIKKLRESQIELRERKKEHRKIADHINILENASTVNNDAIEQAKKGSNKALSRIGALKKEFNEIKEALTSNISVGEELAIREAAEHHVAEYYKEKIKQVEGTVVDKLNKNELLEAINKSKDSIITELRESDSFKHEVRKLANDAVSNLTPETKIVEKVVEFNPASSKKIQDQLKKDIDHRFTREMANVRRLIEITGGGGTNAVQYANGGTMEGDLNITGNILSSGVDISSLFDSDDGSTGVVGPGTTGTLAVFDSITSIGDSSIVQTSDGIVIDGNITTSTIALSTETGSFSLSANDSSGLFVNGNQTVYGNLSVLGDFTYIDSTVSVTSALSVINDGTAPAIYAEQSGVGNPIAKFIDSEGGAVTIGDGGQVAANSLSAVGRVEGSNISTIENRVAGLYSYLINNFDTNTVTGATDLTDFVTNYPKTGLTPGDVITLSANNTAYILGDNDGSTNSDWLEVNLKPNFIFYRSDQQDYSTIDCVALSAAKSSKYIMQVEDMSDSAIFYGEINVVSDGTIAVTTEYSLNHTTVFPFVEFGAEVVNGRVCLSAVALEGKDMSNFTFKGNRSNLFG